MSRLVGVWLVWHAGAALFCGHAMESVSWELEKFKTALVSRKSASPQLRPSQRVLGICPALLDPR